MHELVYKPVSLIPIYSKEGRKKKEKNIYNIHTILELNPVGMSKFQCDLTCLGLVLKHVHFTEQVLLKCLQSVIFEVGSGSISKESRVSLLSSGPPSLTLDIMRVNN